MNSRVKKTQFFVSYLRYARVGIAAFCIALAGLSYTGGIAAPLKKDTPRLLNYFLKWQLTEAEARELAKWDIVIVDRENQLNNPDMLNLMRRINPGIKIFAYIPAQEVEDDVSKLNQSISRLRQKEIAGIQNAWWLKKPTGDYVSWWPGTRMLNLSLQAPTANGKQWVDYLSDFVVNEILASGLWDGIFYDNTWHSVVPYVGRALDVNGDGAQDDGRVADRTWREGIHRLLTLTREKYKNTTGKETLLFGNGGFLYEELNGVLVENFPDNGWTPGMRLYQRSAKNGFQPSVGLINATTGNTGNKTNYQDFRFAYTSSLLYDGYFSYDFGDKLHEQTWWYDEYNVQLGAPLSAALLVENNSGAGVRRGVWKRDFEKGLVVVNSDTVPRTVRLPGEFETLRGTQDPRTNNGLIVDSLTLPPEDGRILRRPLQEVRDQLFFNGSFVRVVNARGVSVRNGFFSYISQLSGGLPVVVTKLSTANADTVITTQGQSIVAYDRATFTETLHFTPYEAPYKGGILFAVGDITGDGVKEIVTVTAQGTPLVRAFNLQGTQLWSVAPFGTAASHGATIALGNIDDKIGADVVLGELGGPSRVVVVKGDGVALDGFYQPYGKKFTDGIDVAAGDVDKNGRDEIIIVPRKGTQNPATVVDGRAFVFHSTFDLQPVSQDKKRVVEAHDIDSDGTLELLFTEE